MEARDETVSYPGHAVTRGRQKNSIAGLLRDVAGPVGEEVRKRRRHREEAFKRFMRKQYCSRRFIPLAGLARCCSDKDHGYDLLVQAILAGMFQRDDRSQVLYLSPVIAGSQSPYAQRQAAQLSVQNNETPLWGENAAHRFTLRLTPDILEQYLKVLPFDSVLAILSQCFVPRVLAKQWLDANGLAGPGFWFPAAADRGDPSKPSQQNRQEWKPGDVARNRPEKIAQGLFELHQRGEIDIRSLPGTDNKIAKVQHELGEKAPPSSTTFKRALKLARENLPH